jgi:hypothetical protein
MLVDAHSLDAVSAATCDRFLALLDSLNVLFIVTGVVRLR